MKRRTEAMEREFESMKRRTEVLEREFEVLRQDAHAHIRRTERLEDAQGMEPPRSPEPTFSDDSDYPEI